jgi:glutaredoxin
MLGRRGVLLTGGIVGAVSLKRGVISPRVAGCAAASSSAPTAGAENTNITVYQYKICPFCSKVKTYLDYLKVPYDTVEVNPLTKGELGFSKDYKKVPIMMVGPENQQINESDQIIAFITANLKAKEKAGAGEENFSLKNPGPLGRRGILTIGIGILTI